MRPATAIVALTLALPLVAPAAGQHERFAAVLDARFARLAVAGLGYAVVEGGRIAEIGGLGIADAATGRLVDGDTPFRIASLTKPIAAALLLGDIHAGSVDLATLLRDASPAYRDHCPRMRAYFDARDLPFLDRVPCDSDAITLGHVLTHTAAEPPGHAFVYNGFLFGLLGDAVASGLSDDGPDGFSGAVRTHVIERLGLERSAAGIDDAAARDVVADLAVPHRLQDGEWIALPPLEDGLNAGAGFVASAGDMARLDIAIRGELLDDPTIWARMTAPVRLADGSRSPYAKGWFVQRIEGRTVIWHHGHQPGAYSALWIRDAGQNRSLVLLANAGGLALGDDLHLGDLRRSDVAMAFLDWSLSAGNK